MGQMPPRAVPQLAEGRGLLASRVLKKCRFWRVLASGWSAFQWWTGFVMDGTGRGRSSSTRFNVCAASFGSLGEQFGQADEVIGGHRERELPIDLEQSAMPHLA